MANENSLSTTSVTEPCKPRTVSLTEAAALLGIPRSSAYELARADRFPVKVIRAGRTVRVPTAPLERLLDPEHDQIVG